MKRLLQPVALLAILLATLPQIAWRPNMQNRPNLLQNVDYRLDPLAPTMVNPSAALEEKWLLSSIREDGAIAMSPSKDRVVPYFSNLAALALLNRNPEAVKKYIQWYVAHLGKHDPWGMKGTITDYIYKGDEEISTLDYDSADAYAGTFLTLVLEYHNATGDSTFLETILPQLHEVANTILALQSKDGLVRAKISDPSKYLMDNCEAYRGLCDFSHLLSMLGDQTDAVKYYRKAQAIRQGIQQRLWDPKTNSYYWRVHWLGFRQRSNLAKWYPDAISQLYPILTQVIAPNSDEAKAIWDSFNRHFPGWPVLNRGQKFAWRKGASVSFKMGDMERSQTFVESLKRLFEVKGKPASWYATESSMLIMVKDILWQDSNRWVGPSPHI